MVSLCFCRSKYEEIYPPDVNEFVYITDHTYTKKQVLRMEQLILKVLTFDLFVPTTTTFVNLYATMNPQDERVRHLTAVTGMHTLVARSIHTLTHPLFSHSLLAVPVRIVAAGGRSVSAVRAVADRGRRHGDCPPNHRHAAVVGPPAATHRLHAGAAARRALPFDAHGRRCGDQRTAGDSGQVQVQQVSVHFGFGAACRASITINPEFHSCRFLEVSSLVAEQPFCDSVYKRSVIAVSIDFDYVEEDEEDDDDDDEDEQQQHNDAEHQAQLSAEAGNTTGVRQMISSLMFA